MGDQRVSEIFWQPQVDQYTLALVQSSPMWRRSRDPRGRLLDAIERRAVGQRNLQRNAENRQVRRQLHRCSFVGAAGVIRDNRA